MNTEKTAKKYGWKQYGKSIGGKQIKVKESKSGAMANALNKKKGVING